MKLSAGTQGSELSLNGVPQESRRRYRRITAAALSALLGKGTSILVSAATVPLTIRYLGSEGFGLWVTISSAIAMFFVFDIGIASTLTNLISEAYAADDRKGAAHYLATALWLVVGISSLLGILGWGIWPYIDWATLFHVQDPELAHQASRAVAAAFIVFLCALPAGLATRLLGGYQEVHAANFFTAGGNVLSLVAVVLVIYLHGSLSVLVGAYAGSVPASHVACLVWMCFFHKPWLKPWPTLIKRHLAGKIFRSGGQFFLIQIAGLVVFNCDNLVISHYLSPAQVAPYNVTWRIASFVTAMQVLVVPALWPAYSEAYARGDLAWIRAAYSRNRWMTFAVLTLGCGILLGAGQRIILWWAGAAAVPSTTLLRLMCLWMIIFAITLNQSCLMGATSRMKKQAVFSVVAAVVNLVLSILWVKTVGSSRVDLQACKLEYSIVSPK